jgi:hypothetical protein
MVSAVVGFANSGSHADQSHHVRAREINIAVVVLACGCSHVLLAQTLVSVRDMTDDITVVAQSCQVRPRAGDARALPSFKLVNADRHHGTMHWESHAIATAFNAVFDRKYSGPPSQQQSQTSEPTHAILISEGSTVSTDAPEFYKGTARLMQMDSSVWCSAALNEEDTDSSAVQTLIRSDRMPTSSGFMISVSVWRQLNADWAGINDGQWKAMAAKVMSGRHCVYPQLSRQSDIGQHTCGNDARRRQSNRHRSFYRGQMVHMKPDVIALLLPAMYSQMVRRLLSQGNVLPAPVTGRAVAQVASQHGVYIIPYLAEEAQSWAKQIFGGDKMGTFDGVTVVRYAKGDTNLVFLRKNSRFVTPQLRQLFLSLGHKGV